MAREHDDHADGLNNRCTRLELSRENLRSDYQ